MEKNPSIQFLEESFWKKSVGRGGGDSYRDPCLGGFSEMESQMYARCCDEVLIDETTNSFPWEIGLEGANNSAEEI